MGFSFTTSHQAGIKQNQNFYKFWPCSMGWGLPAIGAFMPEEKNKQYYLFNGEGGLQMI